MSLATFLSAHDLRLLGGGLLASLMLCSASFCIMPMRPAARDGAAIARTGIAGVLLGATIWIVLLLSWKGFFPFVDAETPLSAVAASMALAICGATATLAIAVNGEAGNRNTVLAGSILAATVSCMLFVTMSAIAAPLVMGYNLLEVLLSMIGCTLVCSAGLHGIRLASTRRQMLLPGVLVAIAIPVLNLASLSAILPFTEWETASATPGALALQPLTVVFLSEFVAILALTRAGAQVDRRTAARTREENERLRQLTDSTFEGLLVHRNGLVLDANAAFCAMAGLTLDAVKGRPIGDFAQALAAVTGPVQAGHHPIETELLVADGAAFPVEMLSREINLGDGQVQVTAVRDIRERRAAEQSARDRQQVEDLRRETDEARERQRIAEEASRAKSAFLAMMSHEIRTPMNAVLGLAATLLDDGLTPDQEQAVFAIKSSGDNLLRILNDILDFSRLDAGRMTFEQAAFSPVDLTLETLQVHRLGAAEKGLLLNLMQEADLPDRLIGDAGRIRQVLHNLVSNAVKFTRSGSVTVHARVVSRVPGARVPGARVPAQAALDVALSPEAGPTAVRDIATPDETAPDKAGQDERSQDEGEGGEAIVEWTITDTGIGIAQDQLGGLFDAFVQADSSITRRFGGSGLGLAISRQLVERMGGTISVTSFLGLGSMFVVRLRLRLADARAVSALPPAAADLLARKIELMARPLRLLLAEDNPTNRFVFSRLLRGTGVEIGIAENGIEAVEAAEQSGYDLICMDMSMPVMDGLDATRAIRAGDGPNRRVPIIALTANAFAEDVAACRAAGMDDFLSKPVSKDVLFAAILRCLPPARDGEIETPGTASMADERRGEADRMSVNVAEASMSTESMVAGAIADGSPAGVTPRSRRAA